MAQASLTPGPGTVIRDALEPDLSDEAVHEVPFPCTVSFAAGWTAVAADEFAELVGWSDAAGTLDRVSYGAVVSQGAGAFEDQITADVYRQFVQVETTVTLTSATLRLQHDHIEGDN